ncbi:hypothetical protein [Paenibacillus sp. WLX2291]|uniref:hypothetical protein n=1 Tax=Paenibacillus sp. WLX2291 TaxID=3296934 RepID=UPI003984250E
MKLGKRVLTCGLVLSVIANIIRIKTNFVWGNSLLWVAIFVGLLGLVIMLINKAKSQTTS